MTLEPGLYVTATPIGNLKDITCRAVETMKAADAILCEDTRKTGRLCAAYGIETPLRPYHDHNASAVRPAILERLKGGDAICLVSDAGTPLISDPGYKLVRQARDAGIAVRAVPGASAAIAALSVAGAPSDRFLFAGFPPAKENARRAFFEDLSGVAASLVFYETGPRLAASLADMAAAFGDRRAAVARELTKMFEDVVEGALCELAWRYGGEPARGEIVVIVHPPAAAPAGESEIEAFLRAALAEMSVKDAAAAAADALGAPKKLAYKIALELKDGS